MWKRFRQLTRELFTPDSVDVNLGSIKLKYTNEMRNDVALVLGALKSKRVLFANVEHELWNHVFDSLRNIRQLLAELSGKVLTRGPSDVNSAVNFMLEVVTLYLADYEANYIRFMHGPNPHNLAPPHLERNWPELGDAASDLIALRRVIYAAVANLNQYASTGEVVDWKPLQSGVAEHWVNYAQKRKLCPKCGWNMFYAYDDECPVCPSIKTVFRLKTCRWPKRVAIAGSFNDWKPLDMSYDRLKHSWVYRLSLQPGLYEYKFIVDEEWLVDPDNSNTVMDARGNINSVLQIK